MKDDKINITYSNITEAAVQFLDILSCERSNPEKG